ncbi:MAG: radical SAM protein [Deltaproteobacteria bacterium]|nr:radical SAM protein [Deltaproteobacteria bacterium]
MDTVKHAAVHQKRHWVRLTRACNNRCMFCLDSGAHDGHAIPEDQVRARIVQGRADGAQRLILSGGEPTIHPRFLDLVAFGRESGYDWIQTITNGRMMGYRRFADTAAANGLREATFSMHAHRADLYDRLVGVEGAFPQAIRGLRNALDLRLVVSVDVVLNRLNLPHLREILEFYMAMGVFEFDLLYLVPFGRGFDEFRAELYPDEATVRLELERALALAGTPGLYLWTNRLPIRFLEGHEELFQDPHKLYDEVLGERESFRELFADGRDPACLGPRCGSCFIEGFCTAARRYAAGDWDRTAPADAEPPLPRCMGGPGDVAAPTPDSGVVGDDGRVVVDRFVAFFIRRLYRVKSLRCRQCEVCDDCCGVHVEVARRRGLGVLDPKKVV